MPLLYPKSDNSHPKCLDCTQKLPILTQNTLAVPEQFLFSPKMPYLYQKGLHFHPKCLYCNQKSLYPNLNFLGSTEKVCNLAQNAFSIPGLKLSFMRINAWINPWIMVSMETLLLHPSSYTCYRDPFCSVYRDCIICQQRLILF